MVADLSTDEGIAELANVVRQKDNSLDLLINNAGAAGAPLDEFPQSGWDKVMNVNVKAMFFLTQTLLPELRASATADDPARVVNIGSVDGLRVPRSSTSTGVKSGRTSHDARAGSRVGR